MFRLKVFALILWTFGFANFISPVQAQNERALQEQGRPGIELYAADSYGTWQGDVKVGSRQNWGVTQDSDGVIYVANQDGVLSYDGTRWSVIPVQSEDPGRSNQESRKSVFSIERLPSGHSDAGRILVGATGEFGMLHEDDVGRQTFHALSRYLNPDEKQQLGTVSQIAATQYAAYFLTDRRLYRWQDDSVSVWSIADLPDQNSSDQSSNGTSGDRLRGDRAAGDTSPAPAFSSLFTVRDTPYVHVKETGLFRVNGGQLQSVSPQRPFADVDVRVVLPSGTADRPSLLVGTQEEGFFELARSGAVRALEWPAESWLRAHDLSHGVRLADGTLALATRDAGVARVTNAGRIIHVLDTDTGLHTNVVNHLFVDDAGSLWLSLGDGVSRVDVSAPFTYFDEALGLSAGVQALARHENMLYACTRNGLHRLDTSEGAFPQMTAVPGVEAHCTGLASTPNGLITATNKGTIVYRTNGTVYPVDDEAAPLPSSATTVLHPAADRAFVAGNPGGIRRLHLVNGRWTSDPTFTQPPELTSTSIHDLAWDDTGSLWAAGPDAVLRVADADSPSPTVTRFDETSGLPVSRDMRVFAVDGNIVVSTQHGLHRPADHAFVPEPSFGASWAEEDAYVTHLIETEGGGVWGRAIEAGPDGSRIITSMHKGAAGQFRNSRPFVPFRDGVRGPFFIEGAVVWIGDRGLAPLSRLDFSSILQTSASPPGPASRVTNDDASTGAFIRRVSLGPQDSTIAGRLQTGASLRIPFSRQNLTIEYALPRFVLVATPVEYRTRLDAGDSWSSWSRHAAVSYASLSPGTYRFQVQARLPGEAPNAVTTLSLQVVPPWYQSSWALALWVVLGLAALGGFVLGGVRWRTQTLERRQRRLEDTVDQRTRQVQAKNDQLANQADRLQRMDRVKSEFFANVSHEFRTPLTLIIGPLEDLQADPRSSLSTVAQQNVAFALRNSQRLLRLIGQLLDTAKLETGNLTLNTQVLNLNTFVHGLTRSFAPLAERGGVEIQVDVPDAPTPVDVDPDTMEKMFGNLISNALKFTPNSSTVYVTVYRKEKDAVLTVQDSGPGIPEEEQMHIFDRFYQSDTAKHSTQPGTGIGLALAKELTELHGGTITVKNGEENGAVFTVRLPISDRSVRDVSSVLSPARPIDSAAAAQASVESRDDATVNPDSSSTPTDPDYQSTKRSNGNESRNGSTEQSRNGAEDRTINERITLLIVDDNDEIRTYVRSHFEPQYRILEARNGHEALGTARTHLPDLIISDVMMPDMDGFELVRTLRSQPETDFLPIILLTARATEEDRITGLDEGADAYVTKPFSMRELHTRVENLIASRMRLKERYAAASVAAEDILEPRELEHLSPAERAYLERARGIVIAHLDDEDFGVEDLAEALSQSRSTVYRRLRDSVEQSPTAFIREVRLRHAAAMLREKRGTVSEIAYAVGFKSVSHFSQSFRDVYSVVPSDYLNRMLQG